MSKGGWGRKDEAKGNWVLTKYMMYVSPDLMAWQADGLMGNRCCY